jgi:hypothetical protein
MAKPEGWKSASDILAALLPNLASGERLREYRVWEVWEAAVGSVVARKAQPSKIQRGRLFVTVSNSAYLQEMQFYKAQIRDAVNQRLSDPVVTDIFFTLGRVTMMNLRPEAPPRRPLPPFQDIPPPQSGRPELDATFASLLAARRRRLNEEKEEKDEER